VQSQHSTTIVPLLLSAFVVEVVEQNFLLHRRWHSSQGGGCDARKGSFEHQSVRGKQGRTWPNLARQDGVEQQFE
jgi:hypothetical protein